MKIHRVPLCIAVLLCSAALAPGQQAPKASDSAIMRPKELNKIVASALLTKPKSSDARILELTDAVKSLEAYNQALEKRVIELAAENQKLLLELQKLKPTPAESKDAKTP